MSSKRAIRRKACKGKIRHTTMENGAAALRNLDRAGKVGEARINVYPCRFCGGFHVGHTPSRKR